jgi:exopolysaccharide biosynthesis polyprenyl glycosylphosphotransferase
MVFSIAGFYISGLYEVKNLKNNLKFVKIFLGGISFTFLFGLSFFYLFPKLGITPRLNLFLFITIYSIIDIASRYFFNILLLKYIGINVFLMGDHSKMEEIKNFINQNPQAGYKIIGEGNFLPEESFLKENRADLIIVDESLKNDKIFSSAILKYFNLNIDMISLQKFYENIFSKVPITRIENRWFFENITNKRPFYSALKNISEFLIALVLLFITLPIQIIIAVLVKITSEGPIIFKQNRIGKNGKIFVLYKFRTMIKDAEKDGIKKDNNEDRRVTAFGKILRKTHLDELPQLVNILKGEISFVGPRPERPELVEEFKKEIPFYEIRHIVKPGLTGWAQLNFRHGLTKEDAYEKLQYDIFYIKNRSFIFDLLIMIKTIRSFFVNPA